MVSVLYKVIWLVSVEADFPKVGLHPIWDGQISLTTATDCG